MSYCFTPADEAVSAGQQVATVAARRKGIDDVNMYVAEASVWRLKCAERGHSVAIHFRLLAHEARRRTATNVYMYAPPHIMTRYESLCGANARVSKKWRASKTALAEWERHVGTRTSCGRITNKENVTARHHHIYQHKRCEMCSHSSWSS